MFKKYEKQNGRNISNTTVLQVLLESTMKIFIPLCW